MPPSRGGSKIDSNAQEKGGQQMSAGTRTETSRRSDATRALRVVCGIDASRADDVAARAACSLAGSRGHVAFVCVVYSSGVGLNAQATIGTARATRALERAMEEAKASGVGSSVYLLRSPHAADALLGASEDGDVLVVGTHHVGRAGGIALGAVATAALHRATVPVLVARPVLHEGGPILIASDGSPASERAARMAGAIAGRDTPVILFTVDHDGGSSAARNSLARQAVELTETTGREPTIALGGGDAAEAIVDAAEAVGCSLLVMGSGGRAGLHALGSVSERVAHRAHCPVLVARPGRATDAST